LNRSIFRSALFYSVLTGGVILVDLAIDRFISSAPGLSLPHISLAALTVVISYIILSRALEVRRRAEAVLRQARDEMEIRVGERTAELEHTNKTLQTEIAEHQRAEQERARMEQALRESEETARVLMNASTESAMLIDTQGIVLAANETAAQRFRTTTEHLIGNSLFTYLPLEAANRRRTYLDLVLRTCQPAYFEDDRDGRTYEIYMHPVFDVDGKIIRIATFGKDITDRRQSELTIRASEEKFATVFHLSPDAIGIVRIADETVLDVNAAFTKMLGYSREEVLGKLWTELGLVPERNEQLKLVEQFNEKGKVVDYELEFTTREANVATLLLSLIPITVSGEACILAIAHDITERKRSEEALHLVQAELALGIRERTSMEERQRLARELHDSVSQALYGISLGAHTALTLFDTDRARALEALNYIITLTHAGLTEMRALIFELRPESLEMEGLVAALTKQAAVLQERQGIQVELSLCDEPDAPVLIKEALYRIGQEALHNAMKHARPNRLDVRMTCDMDCIELDVSDDGVGFDPLADYPGHLGLRSMRERAANVGGTMDIISAPDCGTQIRVSVPVSVVQAVS